MVQAKRKSSASVSAPPPWRSTSARVQASTARSNARSASRPTTRSRQPIASTFLPIQARQRARLYQAAESVGSSAASRPNTSAVASSSWSPWSRIRASQAVRRAGSTAGEIDTKSGPPGVSPRRIRESPGPAGPPANQDRPAAHAASFPRRPMGAGWSDDSSLRESRPSKVRCRQSLTSTAVLSRRSRFVTLE